jgi:hypothetical protein
MTVSPYNASKCRSACADQGSLPLLDRFLPVVLMYDYIRFCLDFVVDPIRSELGFIISLAAFAEIIKE